VGQSTERDASAARRQLPEVRRSQCRRFALLRPVREFTCAASLLDMQAGAGTGREILQPMRRASERVTVS